MRKKEREKLIEGIRVLMGDQPNAFNIGMRMLAELAGLDTRVADAMDSLKTKDVRGHFNDPDRKFHIRLKENP